MKYCTPIFLLVTTAFQLCSNLTSAGFAWQVPNQTITVSGMAKIAGKQPMKGIRVAVKGMNNTTYTDSEGNYTIKNVPSKSVLLFSHADAKTSEIPVNGSTSITVGLGRK